MSTPSTTAEDLATRRLLEAIDARSGVAVAFHLPSIRAVASDEQVRAMYFLPDSVALDEVEAIAMAEGGAAILRRDGRAVLPPRCPVAPRTGASLLAAHADDLEVLAAHGVRGSLCIGIGRLPPLPPVAMALDLAEEGIARGAAVFADAPRGEALELLVAVGARLGSETRLPDGRFLVRLENRLAAHLDAARLSDHQRTANCNLFFLAHGRATGRLAEGLACAAAVRLAAGRARLAEAAVRVADEALRHGWSLHRRDPGATTTSPYGDLVPLGFLGMALARVARAGGAAASAAGEVLARLRRHLDAHRLGGLWGYSRGCIPTSTDSALVALSGAALDLEALEPLRGPSGGLRPQLVDDQGSDRSMRRSPATRHWEKEDLPTTALVEAMRIDAGLPPRLEARWWLVRFAAWGGLYLATPTMGAWAIARLASRLDRPSTPFAEEDAAREHPAILRSRREELREVTRVLLAAHREADGGFGRFDPILTGSFAVLAMEELDLLDRSAAVAQLRVLDAFEAPRGTETPFFSTIELPIPGTFEELVAQGERAGTGLVHDRFHAVTLYEDPHRLMTTALACLALHAEASVDAPARPRDSFGASLVRGATPLEQAIRHVRPYAERPVEDPAAHQLPWTTSRVCGLAAAVDRSLDRLGPRLVKASARERIARRIDRTADERIGASTFGFEVRLHGGDDQIDFLWCAARDHGNLLLLHDHAEEDPRLRSLRGLWAPPADGSPPPIAFIDSAWFEFDLDDAPSSGTPSFFFGPARLERPHRPHLLPAAIANIRRVAAALPLDAGTREAIEATARRLERLEVASEVFQTGLMLPRPRSPIRLCFWGSSEQASAERRDALARAGLDEAVVARLREVESIAWRLDLTPAVCLDVGADGISPRVGVECHLGRVRARGESRFKALSESLVVLGAAEAARCADLLAAEGWDEIDDDGGCNRLLAHLKVLVEPDGEGGTRLGTKGYLALNRTRRPRPRPIHP